MNAPLLVPPKRCAVYCRVSSDERLDQSFNSIDAQKEAGHAFIKSQSHEGWIAVADDYDDGGFSGGNMERPALRRLMADIQIGKVDIVVVYKIDRLSRSLADFARMVDVFDRHRVSFSAVTQQINSATSMGRLMLNVLLSFAQFEREVTGERIRDKIAASKAKGMWMGGPLPLGYDVRDRLLVVNETEAKLVRRIFDDFVTVRSATLMAKTYGAEGVVTKGGKPFTKMLRNRIYLGEIQHKGTSFPGQHEAIIDQDLWNLAHAFVERRKQGPREGVTQHPALLAGLLHAPDGQLMIHTYTRKKNGRLYRYYVPYLHKRRNAGATLAPGATDIGPLPAAEIETAVLEQIQQALRAPELMLATWRSCQRHPRGAQLEEAQVVVAMQRIGAVWDQLFPKEQQRITQLMIERVQLHERGLDILWREDGWLGLGEDIASHPLVEETRGAEAEVHA
jgi:DNA invertase Pin-like site-specific DNA recombinase